MEHDGALQLSGKLKPTASPEEFARALATDAADYGVQLSDENVARLRAYYEIVSGWNARLHLVAPCLPSEFATRHVLESLFALPFLKEGARIADIGSGAGLPVIPCLIARPDIRATLIESSSKKSVFLREALRQTMTVERAEVITGRFEEMPAPNVNHVTCRALERFTEMLPRIISWSPPTSTLLLFGGHALGAEIEKLSLTHTAHLIPHSERRYLYIVPNPKSQVPSQRQVL